MPPLFTSSPPPLPRLHLSVLCNKIIKEDSALHCGRQRSPQTLETRIAVSDLPAATPSKAQPTLLLVATLCSWDDVCRRCLHSGHPSIPPQTAEDCLRAPHGVNAPRRAEDCGAAAPATEEDPQGRGRGTLLVEAGAGAGGGAWGVRG